MFPHLDTGCNDRLYECIYMLVCHVYRYTGSPQTGLLVDGWLKDGRRRYWWASRNSSFACGKRREALLGEWTAKLLPPGSSFPWDSEMWKTRERVREAGPVGWRNHSPSCSVGTFLGQYYPDVNQRTQTHCLGTFILKAFGRILKLSNKTREATENI